MMMEELDNLIAAVETGDDDFTGSDDWLRAWENLLPQTYHELLFEDHWHVVAWQCLDGSLDAAMSIHDALLDSGFHAEIQACCTRPRVRVVRGDEVHDGHEQESEACSWLIATLKAYRSDLSKGAEQ